MNTKNTKTEILLPSKSAALQTLLLMAADAGESTLKSVRKVLFSITMHPKVVAGQLAVERLQQVLERKQYLWNEDLEASGILSLTDGVDWLVDNAEKITVLIPVFAKRLNTNRGNPLMGTAATDFPIQTLLCNVPPKDAQHSQAIENLTDQLVVAYVTGLATSEIVENTYFDATNASFTSPLVNSAGPSALAIRTLSETENREYAVSLDHHLPPSKFFETLLNLQTERSELDAGMGALGRFGLKCLGLREWISRVGSKGTNGGYGGGTWRGNNYFGRDGYALETAPSDDAPEDLMSQFEVFVNTDAPAQVRRKKRDEICPSEDEIDFITVSIFSNTDSSEDCPDSEVDIDDSVENHNEQSSSKECQDRSEARRKPTDAQRHHIHRAGLRLPQSTAFISSEELQKFVDALVSEKHKQLAAGPSKTARIDTEIIVALYLCMMFCKPVEEVLDIRMHSALPRKPLTTNQVAIVKDANGRKTMLLLAKAIEPPYTTDGSSYEAINNRSRAKHATILDAGTFLPLIELLDKKRPRNSNTSRPLFTLAHKQLRDGAAEFIRKTLNRKISSRKVADTMLSVIADQFGDLTTACCALGIENQRKTYVPLFYTTQESHFLTKGHYEATASLFRSTPMSNFSMSTIPVDGSAIIGARLCPTTEEVADGVCRLKRDLQSMGPLDIQENVNSYHNLYSAYVSLQLTFSTLHRPITSPIPQTDAIDLKTSTLAISDKNDDIGSKTRLGLLPDCMARQLGEYSKHFAVIKRNRAFKSGIHPQMTTIIISGATDFQAARPSLVHEQLRKYLPYPVNTGRRFMRSELVRRGVQQEEIDILLGHFSDGEGCTADYSATQFNLIAEAVLPVVSEILASIGLDSVLVSRLVEPA